MGMNTMNEEKKPKHGKYEKVIITFEDGSTKEMDYPKDPDAEAKACDKFIDELLDFFVANGPVVSGEQLEELRKKSAELAGFKLTREQAKAEKRCIKCGEPVHESQSNEKGALRTPLEVKEWEISFFCGPCWDEMVETEDD